MEVRFPGDERPPAWKIVFLQYVIAIAFLGLLVGYWRLQVGRHRYFVEQAERNRIRNLPVIAPRGRKRARAVCRVQRRAGRPNSLDPVRVRSWEIAGEWKFDFQEMSARRPGR